MVQQNEAEGQGSTIREESRIVACLPYVSIDTDAYRIGRATFWNATSYKDHLPASLHESFCKYIDWVTTFQVRLDPGTTSVTTPNRPKDVTCVSIAQVISDVEVDRYLFDALQCSPAFFGNHRSILHGAARPLNSFLHVRNAEVWILQSPDKWSSQYNLERIRENTFDLRKIPGRFLKAADIIIEQGRSGPQKRKARRLLR